LRDHLAPFYSHTGRPSIDPELMIRMLVIGYSFGIRSERRLCEEVHLNLAYRWFCQQRSLRMWGWVLSGLQSAFSLFSAAFARSVSVTFRHCSTWSVLLTKLLCYDLTTTADKPNNA
jgi:hypothetical protein